MSGDDDAFRAGEVASAYPNDTWIDRDAVFDKSNKDVEEAKAKAAEERKKALAEAEAKAAEEAAAALKPEDKTKEPIKFKDCVGRKFSFPWDLAKTWRGMEELIKQAFLHVDVIGPHVHEGHYDLVDSKGEIILPQVWESMIQP
ncbi:hypothetical protein CC80DRAFT_423495, partial [Byssothecium circinans]